MNSLNPYLATLALFVPGASAQASAEVDGLYISHLENVLGTSFDLKVVARSYAVASQAETAALAEIGRLTQILSSYRNDSEFSRWLASPGIAVRGSADLLAVLSGFDQWRERTNGAINAAAEGINRLWQRAADSQVLPSEAERARAVSDAQQVHWQVDAVNQTVTRLSRIPLRLHSFAKSYVLDRATEAALAVPDVRAIVMNIGGDLVIRGDWTESVAVADPRADAENALPLARLIVQNRAVATSGNYRRGVRVGADWYAHIVDPRTGLPVREVVSATVVHPDAGTAGALATAFNILSPTESEQLAATLPGTDYLIIRRDGQQVTSPTWRDLLNPDPPHVTGLPSNAPALRTTARLLRLSVGKDQPWNPKQELLISVELSQIEGRSHRPFVAVWVEDEHHVPVRNLALWYNKPRWLPELRAWYATQRSTGFDAAAIASATRSPGAYTLKWDGKDDQGQYVKQGKYTICIEAAREHGTYQLIRQEMNFNGQPQQQTLSGNVEIATAALDYH